MDEIRAAHPRRLRRHVVIGAVLALLGTGLLLPTTTSAASTPAAEILTVPAAPTAPATSQLDQFESTVLSLINRDRRAAGLVALLEVPSLNQVSNSWSDTLAGRGRYGANTANPSTTTQVRGAGITATQIAQAQARWYPATAAAETVHVQLMANADTSAKIRAAGSRYVGISRTENFDGITALVLTFVDQVGSVAVVDPVRAASPTGSLTGAVRSDGVVTLTGRATDPDATGPVGIRVQDSASGATWTSTGPEFSVAAGPLAVGPHQLCVTAVNQNVGADLSLGCVDVTVPVPAFHGTITVTAVDRAMVTVAGQVTTTPEAHATVAAEFRAAAATPGLLTSSTARLGLVNPDSTGRYDIRLASPDGPGEICLTAKHPTLGNQDLACAPVDVPTRIIGSHDKAYASGGQVVITGWAHDITSPTTVLTGQLVLTDTMGTRTVDVVADRPRADVPRYYPAAGELHGVQLTLPIRTTGQMTACLTLNTVQDGVRPRAFACKSLTV